jgi:hypothetical protein
VLVRFSQTTNEVLGVQILSFNRRAGHEGGMTIDIEALLSAPRFSAVSSGTG